MAQRITSFKLHNGRRIGRSYEVERRLGGGTEGEVYQIRDRVTDIRRAAKLFFPHRDPSSRLSVRHAQKLERLRSCPIVLQYHHSEEITVGKIRTRAVISELCRGEQLQRWVERHRGKRLRPYVALTILHTLVKGIETVHEMGEYHADVHTENILLEQSGVEFRLKLIDFYEWGKPTRPKMQQDVFDAVRVLHDMMGGWDHYADAAPEVKYICAGMRADTILSRFPSMSALRHHLESFKPKTLF